MSPHNDRCRSQAPVSLDPGLPGTVVTTSMPSWLDIHNSTESKRHVSNVLDTVQTYAVMGISSNSYPFDTASSSKYWGRQRYGPVPYAFEIA